MGKTCILTEEDARLFLAGEHYTIYEKMGAHPVTLFGEEGTYFAVWAPNADKVSVVGDFNEWKPGAHEMELMPDYGIWHLFIPGVGEGDLYKYVIESQAQGKVFKADPYAGASQLRPETASVVTDLDGYEWEDTGWQQLHQTRDYTQPMAIYEVHPGSWKKNWNRPGGFMDYVSLAHELADYVLDMGYTHVELMGIAEHPFDGSWGYQVSGYYAPTARYGSPKDFMYMVDYLHTKGIGVILDWVPAHFPKDDFGLGRFDGTALYEHLDPRKGERREWGTYCFNYSRKEVANFLIANALYWIEKFHVDGLRADAVASMLYLDFGRTAGEWIPNKDGGNQDYEAMDFIRRLNTVVSERDPGAMIIAEESTAWPMVSGPVADGGLGFNGKWNMGWMHDFLEYMQTDPIFRRYKQNNITFSFVYAYSEKFILALSHDEVVHLKKSMLMKMPGSMENKFANLRAAYGLQMMHPGRKLLFMGQEFGQKTEWNEAESLEWSLLVAHKDHRQLQLYYKDLLHFYREHEALYALDAVQEGFQWINGSDADHNMLTFCRMTRDGKKSLLCHFNFSPVAYEHYRCGALCSGDYREIFNSNDEKYGGTGMINAKPVMADDRAWDYKDYSIDFKVGPYAMCVFEFDYISDEEKRKMLIRSVIEKELAHRIR